MAYHHGNAHQALIDAAGDLLEREGASGLSLRQVAERAGLSRQAPYNHFRNKEALLAELVADGFRALSARLDALDDDASPLDRLAGAGGRYIAFGLERPALFRLMFSRELVDRGEHPDAQREGEGALARLSAIVATLHPGGDVGELTLLAWSLVHGYTTLCLEVELDDPKALDRRAASFAQAVQAASALGAPRDH